MPRTSVVLSQVIPSLWEPFFRDIPSAITSISGPTKRRRTSLKSQISGNLNSHLREELRTCVASSRPNLPTTSVGRTWIKGVNGYNTMPLFLCGAEDRTQVPPVLGNIAKNHPLPVTWIRPPCLPTDADPPNSHSLPPK
ncbi:uncharacterized protein LOC144371728 [Ictidomys tridecemlineatus]